jgi:propanol-preferring alcohol dehydrogenase
VLVRIKAAGICHSDVHYRQGVSRVDPLPLTLGHEIAGVVEQVGGEVAAFQPGDRVCLHYMVTCGSCRHCNTGNEQFCTMGKMLGKYQDGGFADFIRVPARNVFRLPEEIPFDQGAVLMCSSATSLHALRKGRLVGGETVAVFGAGGLGASAIQLARALGALQVYAVDIDETKLGLAEQLGAVAVGNREGQATARIRDLTQGRGVDVALELVGLPQTAQQCVRSLAIGGRAVLVGLSDQPFAVEAYAELIMREAEIIGCSDHLAQELPLLLELARRGALDLTPVISHRVSLDAAAINDAMDRMQRFGSNLRVVVCP